MNRVDLFKAYYKKTDSHFTDHIILTRKDRELAWRKHQYGPSKFIRKLMIVEQYLLLFVFCIIGGYVRDALILCVGFGLFFLDSLITEFSLIKIELLYRIYSKDNIYAKMLCRIFFCEAEAFFDLLKVKTKKYISGYVRKNLRNTVVSYMVIYRERSIKATLIFKRNCVDVKLMGSTHRINDSDLSDDDLANEISSVLLKNIVCTDKDGE